MSLFFEHAPARVLTHDGKNYTEIHNDTFVCYDDFSIISKGKRNKWYYRERGEDSPSVKIEVEHAN